MIKTQYYQQTFFSVSDETWQKKLKVDLVISGCTETLSKLIRPSLPEIVAWLIVSVRMLFFSGAAPIFLSLTNKKLSQMYKKKATSKLLQNFGGNSNH